MPPPKRALAVYADCVRVLNTVDFTGIKRSRGLAVIIRKKSLSVGIFDSVSNNDLPESSPDYGLSKRSIIT